jgi:beta-glucosidase
LALEFRLGFFDDDELVSYTSIPFSVVNSVAHRALATEAARESIVLLRNGAGFLLLYVQELGAEGALLITGPNAQLFATGNYNTVTDVNVTALDGIRAVLPGASFEPGCASVASNDTSFIPAAARAASAAKAVIAVMGIDGTQEYEDSTRASLALPGVQDELLRALIQTGTPVVLVLMGGSAVAPASDVLASVKAVLWAGYGGEEAGTALADVLFGNYNPGGRLPITFYTSVDVLPPYLNMSMTGLPYGRTLRYFLGPAPIYRFGEGISYSQFKLTSPNVTAAGAVVSSFAICESLQVTCNASNYGPLDGDSVIQIFTRLRNVPGARTTPLLSLSGFQRVSLAVGETVALSFTLSPRVFAIVDEDARAWGVFPVDVDVFVGEQSPAPSDWANPAAVRTLQMTGSPTSLDACNVPY